MNFMQATQQAPTGGVSTQPPTLTVYVTVPSADGKTQTLQVPATHEEMQQLMSRRSQLSSQLDNVTDRRNDIVEQIRTAPNVAQPGLTAQLKILDNRIVQLETDLATTGRQVAAASPVLMEMAEPPPSANEGDVEEATAAGAAGMFVAMSVLLLFLRRRWRRRAGGRVPALPNDSGQRLMRLEQGMDAIAVEIERISEGQRFVTRLLSESHGAAPAAQRVGEPTTMSARDQNR